MENTGGSRAGHTELGQLVQQRAFARADRAHPASGGGKRLLSANGRSGQSGLTKTKQPPENPGRFRTLETLQVAAVVVNSLDIALENMLKEGALTTLRL